MPRRFTPLFVLPLLTAQLGAAEFFVAPDGSDTNPGTKDAPFATLTRARDEARKHKSGPRTVFVREGRYEITATLKFGPEDSGTAESPVVWRAFENEKPVLIGGRAISGWKPWRAEILQADVAAQGFKGVAFKQLFVSGKRQQLARYPNFDAKNPYGGGWAFADGEEWPMYSDIPGENKHTLKYRTADARTWSRPVEVEVFVLPRHNWWNDIVPVASVDAVKREVTLAKDCSYAVRRGDRYFFQNALEELDAPGEWYLDRTAGTLYFWPPAPLHDGDVIAPTTRTILEFAPKTAHITVRGFTIECCDGNAIVLSQTDRCIIAANTIRNVGDIGGSGVVVNGGTENGVTGNDIHDIGRTCISLGGGDRQTLTPAGNCADNNYLHHFGVFYKQGSGISLTGVGNRATHNLIHDGPRFGIDHGGNRNVIEFNRIRHVSLETEDTGAIYSGGRDWITPRGTAIRYNFITDIWGYGHADGKWVSPYFAWGIYLDDNSAGADVIGNIVARCARGGMHAHAARDTVVENNIWVDNGQWQVDFHGWTTAQGFWLNHLPTMTKGYESVASDPAWKGMRGMEYHPKDAPVGEEGFVTRGNVFTHNIAASRDPKSTAFSVLRIPFTHNRFDENLYWNASGPLRTGYHSPGKPLSENLAPNADFHDGNAGELPKDWSWQIRPLPTATAALAEDPMSRKQMLWINAAVNKNKPRDNYPIVGSKEFALPPGHSYRLSARLRATNANAKAAMMVQLWIPAKDGKKAHFWSGGSDVRPGPEWKEFTSTFRTPAPGEKGWDDRTAANFRIRFDFKDEAAALFISDVALHEVETLDEWQSWQAQGNDQHGIVADPQFIDWEHDDFRLRPTSPALKLGFQQIPVEKIGPYASPDRASWPIVEAEGAREHPLTQ
jgi:hypothetical protein